MGNPRSTWSPCVASLLLLVGAGCGTGIEREGSAAGDYASTTQAVTGGICPRGATVEGIDVSVYQQSVDWAAVKASGREFGIARVSDGSYQDGYFDGNWSGMKAAGVIRGAYQFFEPGEDAVMQANIVISHVGRLGPGDLPVMLDMEVTGGQSAGTIVAQIHRWVDAITAGTGKTPFIYTGAYFWDDNVGGNGDFASLPLCVAWYGTNCPGVPNAWGNPGWTFHQYSSSGQVPGVSHNPTDVDVFNGPLSALQAFAGGSTNQPPRGYLDQASCAGIAGWSQDPDVASQPINVDVYLGGPAGSGAPGIRTWAGNDRPDLCGALGSCNHAFSVDVPRSLLDGAAHAIHAYGIDSSGGTNPELSSSPRTLTCNPTETGVLRHVVDPTSYSAWRFSDVFDVRPVPATAMAAWSHSVDWPAQPKMIRGSGTPDVYLIDGAFRRHVVSPESAAKWHLDLSAVQVVPDAQVTAIAHGPDLRDGPTLVSAGGAIYELDEPLAPRGVLDSATCSGIAGWSQDQDVPTQAVNVDIYLGGTAGSGVPSLRVLAEASRTDLCGAIGSCAHGFSIPAPRALMDGASHEVHVYGIGPAGGSNGELGGSPQAFACDLTETGVLRRVVDAASQSAWKFSTVFDVRPVSTLGAWPAAKDWPAQPTLVQGSGASDMWMIDGVFRRHVNPTSAAAWHFDLSKAQTLPPAEISALPQGPDLRDRPTLLQSPGSAIYELDDPLPSAPALVADGGLQTPAPVVSGGGKPGSVRGGCQSVPVESGLLPLLAVLGLAFRRRANPAPHSP